MGHACKQPKAYRKGEDFTYWLPLEFGADGRIQQFAKFQDQIELDLPGMFEPTHARPSE